LKKGKFHDYNYLKNSQYFPGGPMVKTLHFHCRGYWFDPGWGTKIPHAMWPKTEFPVWLANWF